MTRVVVNRPLSYAAGLAPLELQRVAMLLRQCVIVSLRMLPAG